MYSFAHFVTRSHSVAKFCPICHPVTQCCKVLPTTSPGHTALHHSDHFVIRSHRFAHFVTRSHSVASFCPLRHPYSLRIFYAVVRQISMLFIDNKDSVFCIRHPITQCCIILPTSSPNHTVSYRLAYFVFRSHSVASFCLFRHLITQFGIVLPTL